ncbi:MAG: hypothetical protein QW318_09510 [Candidatus Caldarchaeum sp.]
MDNIVKLVEPLSPEKMELEEQCRHMFNSQLRDFLYPDKNLNLNEVPNEIKDIGVAEPKCMIIIIYNSAEITTYDNRTGHRSKIVTAAAGPCSDNITITGVLMKAIEQL